MGSPGAAAGLRVTRNELRREDLDRLFFTRRLMLEGDTALGLEVKNALDALTFG